MVGLKRLGRVFLRHCRGVEWSVVMVVMIVVVVNYLCVQGREGFLSVLDLREGSVRGGRSHLLVQLDQLYLRGCVNNLDVNKCTYRSEKG